MRERGCGVRRILVLAGAAVAFGALESVAKGNAAGVRDGIGNLSAPWVILPLLASAAASRGRMWLGAMIGLLTTTVALAAFYLTNAFVLDLGPHSTLHDVSLTLNTGTVWFKAGVVSGPVMGAAGAWLARRGPLAVAASALGILVFEPVAVYLAYLASDGRFAGGNGEWNGIYAAEAALGGIGASVLWRARGRGRN
jgi:Family of unknown function (DUF6518)